MHTTINHHKLTTMALTCGVKESPKATPMTHCPVLRQGFQLSVLTPEIESAEVMSKGPIIQGKGVCMATHACAAIHAANKVRTMRRLL